MCNVDLGLLVESSHGCSISEGIYIPLVSQQLSSSSLRQTVAFAPYFSQALTPTYLNPNPTKAFKCAVIPCENKQIQAPSCVIEHLVDP
jgi:hypothetical protein